MKKVEVIIPGTNKKPITLDYCIPKDVSGPLVVYCHGFKGFKDWGGMDLIADKFAEAGMPFLKFNFSHNGTTPEHLEEFVDKEAFKTNTIGKELNDFYILFKWIDKTLMPKLDKKTNTVLIGHSKGATEAILYAARQPKKISKLITWAATARADIPWHRWDQNQIFEWHKSGVAQIKNSRTGQVLDLGIELLEDFENHKASYDIIKAAKTLTMPWLICHGTEDETVDVSNATLLHEAAAQSELLLIKKTGHTFGRKHPLEGTTLPAPTIKLVNACIEFCKAS